MVVEFEGKKRKQVLGSVLEAKTSWMVGFKETKPVWEENLNLHSEVLMPRGILGYFKIFVKLLDI